MNGQSVETLLKARCKLNGDILALLNEFEKSFDFVAIDKINLTTQALLEGNSNVVAVDVLIRV